MTLGTQMQAVIASIQSAAASIKIFALETQDQQAKQQYNQIAENLENALQTLKQRQQYIEEQEPQYRQQ